MGIQGLISRKYDILQQRANADTVDANTRANALGIARTNANTQRIGTEAQARLQGVQADFLPQSIQADAALRRQQAAGLADGLLTDRALGLERVRAGQYDETQGGRLAPDGRFGIADAERRQRGVGVFGQSTSPDEERDGFPSLPSLPSLPSTRAYRFAIGTESVPEPTRDQRELARRMRTGMGAPPPADDRVMLPRGYAKGTARVSAKDTVPALLSPGEAVLNKPAAESMGRGLIASLNAAGMRKMGMV